MTRPSRFGPNPKRKTIEHIERVTEWVEAQTIPFTNMQAWRATGRYSFNITYLALLQLRDNGLMRRVSPAGAKPALWIRADAPKPEIPFDLEA